MFYFDPLYLVFALPALLLALIAQWRVQAAVNKYSRVHTGRGATGASVARAILDGYGLQQVAVERTGGLLGDHYDPLSRFSRSLSCQPRRPRCVPEFCPARRRATAHRS